MQIAYIGHKASKADNVAGTGVVWEFPGDVREVADAAARLLLLHSDVWAPVETKEPAQAPTQSGGSEQQQGDGGEQDHQQQGEHKWVLISTMEDGSESKVVLDSMDMDALRSLAAEQSVAIDGRKAYAKDAELLREHIYKAILALSDGKE